MISIVAALGLLGPIPGCGQLIIDLVLRPRVDFEAQPLSPRPSYEQTEAWLAHPSVDDPSDRLPEGIEPVPDAERPAALFFVAPTTWFGKQAWNDPLDDDKTQTLTRTMLAGEASPFSAAARIYAPRYRQATAYAFTVSNDDVVAMQDKTYTITGSGHTHELTVTAAQFGELANGMMVVVTSTTDNMHSHTYQIDCNLI